MIALILITLPLTAGGRQEAEPAGAADAMPEEPMTISWFGSNHNGVLLPRDTPAELIIEERFGVEIEPWYNVDAYQPEQWQARIAGGDVADFMLAEPIGAGLVQIGAVRLLTEEEIRTYMPDYVAAVEPITGPQFWRELAWEGKLAGIPSVNTAISSGAALVTRRDWMEAVGYEIPETLTYDYPYTDQMTLDELEELLYRFRHDDPDGNGVQDTYGLTYFKANENLGFNEGGQGAFPSVFGAYNVRIKSWQDIGGDLEYSMISGAYRDALEHLNGWYDRGIIDPEFVTDRRQETIQKYSNGLVGAYEANAAWTGPRADGPSGRLLEADEDATPVWIIAPIGPRGVGNSVAFKPFIGNVSIGKDVDDRKLEVLLSMLNVIQTDMELYPRLTYGEEGIHWDRDENGLLVQRPEFAGAEARMELGLRYFTMWNVITPDIAQYRLPLWRTMPFDIGMKPGLVIDNGFFPTWGEEERALVNQLAELEAEFFFQAIVGQANLTSDWETYVSAWLDNGGQQLTDVANRQYR